MRPRGGPIIESIIRDIAGRLHDVAPHVEPGELPWRSEKTPYRVFVAEFLLIRTRADVVARVFEEVIARYPDVCALAKARKDELSRVLRPVGLRKRVSFLIRASRYLMEEHGGEIPCSPDDLERVPGLGPYTANAIAAFAFDQPVVPADVNVLRFLSRLTGLTMEHPTKGSKDLRRLLPLLSTSNGGPSPEVLLDFSRLVCRSRRPRCEECPLLTDCTYFSARDET